MENQPITLLVREWPYDKIKKALEEFPEQMNQRIPQILWVGAALWMMLREASERDCVDAEAFQAGPCIIRLDRYGILEPHEFMFSLG